MTEGDLGGRAVTGGRRDGWIAAKRCLGAMAGKDEATRKSLWRAACRYMQKDREERTRLENPGAPLPLAVGASRE